MNLIPLNAQLRRGCDALDLSFDVAAELLSFLEIGKLLPESRESFSPSAQIDKLLHWILLNTEARKVVEQYTGLIYHSTNTAKLDEDKKCLRRLHTLNTLAEQGWTPKLAVWEEPQTLMHKITMVELHSNSGKPPGKRFTMYRTNRHGLDEIHKKMSQNDCSINKDGVQALAACVDSQQPAKRQKTAEPAVDAQGKLTVKIKSMAGGVTTVMIRASSQVAVLHNAYARHTGASPNTILLYSNGERLCHGETLQDYLDSGHDLEWIDAMLHQEGCL